MRVFCFLLVLTVLISCKKRSVEGIVIGKTFLEHQSLSENKRLDSLIRLTIRGDDRSLYRLNHFPSVGGAASYEKGYVITQILYKIGEDNFSIMVDKCDVKELWGLEGYIQAGLEYGDNNYDGKSDNKKAEDEFPVLMKKLKGKRK